MRHVRVCKRCIGSETDLCIESRVIKIQRLGASKASSGLWLWQYTSMLTDHRNESARRQTRGLARLGTDRSSSECRYSSSTRARCMIE